MANKKYKYEYKVEIFKPERFQLERGTVMAEDIEQARHMVNGIAADLFILVDRSDRKIEEIRWQFCSIGQGHYLNQEQAYSLLGYEKCPDCEGTGEITDWNENELMECYECKGTGYDHGFYSEDITDILI